MAFTPIDLPTLDSYHDIIRRVCTEVQARFCMQNYIPNKAILKRILESQGIQEHMMDQAIDEVLRNTGKTVES